MDIVGWVQCKWNKVKIWYKKLDYNDFLVFGPQLGFNLEKAQTNAN
jgi:hypothetical protein